MPTTDDLKMQRDGHLWALKPAEPWDGPRDERDERGHVFRYWPGRLQGCVEYVPKNCACTDCSKRRAWQEREVVE